MYIPIFWFLLLIGACISLWDRYRKSATETMRVMLARDEWIMLRMRYLRDPELFRELYLHPKVIHEAEIVLDISEYDYYFVFSYYKNNPDEDLLEAIEEEQIPNFHFSDKWFAHKAIERADRR